MKQLIETRDGSHSLYSPKYDEPYHSRHGAITESMHVFIHMGLHALPEEWKSISLLEMGFGTGLNAFLTYLHKKDKTINYTGVEAEPVEPHFVDSLEYPEQSGHPEGASTFKLLHSCPWDEEVEIGPPFKLYKAHTSLQALETEEKFHLVYFDAFAPTSQPELWTEEVFRKLHGLMLPAGIMTTYSAKGAVRRAMIAAGFEVEKVPGPPGKREMLRARR